MKLHKVSVKVTALVLVLMGIGYYASADTVFLDQAPSAVIKPGDAAKQSKTKAVYKCEHVRQGPNINPVKVPGSQTLWASEVGKGVEDAGDKLADGKTIFRCKSMQIDESSGRMKSVAL